MRSAVLVVALAVHRGGGPPAPARAVARATFGIGPANAQRLDGRAAFNFLQTRGAAVTEHVAVVNNGSDPVTLRVYATDAVPGTGGGADLALGTATPTDAGAWITLQTPDASGNVTIAPRSTTIVPMQVHVPATAAAGDHEAGVVAALTTQGTNAQGERVNLEQRVAVRAFFRIAGKLTARLRVDRVRATYHQSVSPVGRGSVSITYRIRNTGNVKLGAQPAVDFRGLVASHAAARHLSAVATLLPGASVTRSVTLRGVWPQFVGHARVTATPVAAAGDVNPSLSPQRVSRRVWTLPLSTLLFGAVLLGAGYGYRRRRTA